MSTVGNGVPGLPLHAPSVLHFIPQWWNQPRCMSSNPTSDSFFPTYTSGFLTQIRKSSVRFLVAIGDLFFFYFT